MQHDLPSWVLYTQALSPAFIAISIGIFTIFIQIKQWKTANSKLKLDLFEKRMKIYYVTMKYMNEILREGGCNIKIYTDLFIETNSYQFLFGKDIIDWIDKIESYGAQLTEIVDFLKIAPEGQKKSENKKLKYEKLKAINDFRKEASSAFKPYLEFGQVK